MINELVNTPSPEGVVPKRPRGRPKKSAVVAGQSVIKNEKAPVKRVRKVVAKVVVKDKPSLPEVVDGNKYVFAVGRRKKAVARIFIYQDGKGEIEVNSTPLEKYFGLKALQEIAGQALQQSSFKKTVRIIAKVRGGGLSGQAEAIRLGITRALIKLDENLRLTFSGFGYLTRDPRRKERKKYGLKKARRAPQFSKR